MLLEHNGATPKIDPTARIAPNAVLCGEVTIGANSSIGFGAVLTAETGPITVGSNCVIMDTATIRGLKHNCVYRKPKRGRSDDEVRRVSGVNL